MATTWSTTDRQQNTLSNGNLTATATAGGFSSGRTNVSWSSGRIYLEIQIGSGSGSGVNPFSSQFSAQFGSGVFVPIDNSMLIGIANASWNLFAELGQSTPSNSVGVAVGNFDEVYVNNTFFSGGVHPCSPGDTVSMAIDYGVGRFWYSTDQMQIDIGAGAWNNSLTDNPATGAGGLDFSSQTGPFFGAWYSPAVGNSATINAHAPWHRAIPSGFTPADGGASSGTISVTELSDTASNVFVGSPWSNQFSREFGPVFSAGGITGIVAIAGIIGHPGLPNPFSSDFTSDFGSGVSPYTEAPDTMAGAGSIGTVSLPPRLGVLTATNVFVASPWSSQFSNEFGPVFSAEADDTMVATGIISAGSAVFGPITVTEAGDSMVASGIISTSSTPVFGPIVVTEAGDSMVATGLVLAGSSVSGPIIVTEAGDTASATGTVTTVVRSGVISATESADTMLGLGFVGDVCIGAISATESADTMLGLGFVSSVSSPILTWMD